MELKPCPFCGGEAQVVAKPYEPKFCVGCGDDACIGFSGLGWLYDSEQEAAEAWNRRAERTCRIIEDMCGLAHCSECGYEFDPYDCSGIPEEGVPYEYDGRYCKNCGARVVVE